MSSMYEMTHQDDAKNLELQQHRDNAPKRRDEQVGKVVDMIKDELDAILANLDPLTFVELLSFIGTYLEATNDMIGDAQIDFPIHDMKVHAGKVRKATRSVLYGIRQAREILK